MPARVSGIARAVGNVRAMITLAKRASALVGAVTLLTVGMAGCAASTPRPTQTVTVSVTPSASASSPSPTPDATMSPGALVVPPCDQLVPTEVINAQPGVWSNFVFIDRADDPAEALNLPGELASATAEAASRRVDCIWGAPNSDSGVGIDVLQIDEAASRNLVGALREASDEYQEFSISGSPAFLTNAPWGIGEGVVVYVFDGSAWLVMGGHEYDEAAAQAVLGTALENLRTANP